jgi:hypothetical protein
LRQINTKLNRWLALRLQRKAASRACAIRALPDKDPTADAAGFSSKKLVQESALVFLSLKVEPAARELLASGQTPPSMPLEPIMDEDYEVPNPAEEALEKAAEREHDGLAQKIALMTAVLSTIGALINYQSGTAQTEAMFLKNESILKQAQASDQWAYYQSKSTKAHIADAAAALATAPEVRARFIAERDKEEKERLQVAQVAIKLQADSRRLTRDSDVKLRPHEHLALALSFVQIAIALAAITVLTRRRWLLWGAVGFAAVGIGAAITAFVL